MELIKIYPNPNELESLSQVPVHLFPDNFALQLENASIYKRFLHSSYKIQFKNKYLGGIAIYDNPDHIIQGERAISIGYFNCVRDESVSKILLGKAKETALKLGRSYIVGPLNGSTWENYRFRTSDQPSAFILESQTPVYYNNLFTAFGFTPIKKYYSYITNLDHLNEVDYSDPLFFIRSINPDQYEKELRQFHSLAHASFGQNFLFSPYNWEDFIGKYRLLQGISDPSLSFMVEFEGKVAGFAFVLEDILCSDEKRAVLKTIAIHPDYQSRGFGTKLIYHIMNALYQRSFNSCITAYVVEDSLSNAIFKSKSSVYREYLLYSYKI